MKRILLYILLFTTTVCNAQIIADHRAVDEFDQIPQQWIDSVKTKWLCVTGASHASSLHGGLQYVHAINGNCDVTVQYSGAPNGFQTTGLRSSGATLGSFASPTGWNYMLSQEDWWSNPTANTRIKAFLQYCHDTGPDLFATMYGWSFDANFDHMYGNGPYGSYDPVYHTRWAGSTHYGADGNRPWGLDAGDSVLVGNRVTMRTYINSVNQYKQYSTENGIATHLIFSTIPVDDNGTQGWNINERGYQQYLKNEYIRDYVDTQSDVYLFDWADIASYNDAGEYATTTWTDNNSVLKTFPLVHPDNMTGDALSHIGSVGATRYGKAMWWLLARMAGWEGVEQIYQADYYVAPPDSGGSDLNPGTYAEPFGTWQHAFETANAGDTVYFRGGIWYPQDYYTPAANAVTIIAPRESVGVYTGVTHGNSGTVNAPICYFNYPGEVPILDCSQVDTAGHKYNTGLDIYLAEYLHFKGLTVRNVFQTKTWDPGNPTDTTAKVAAGIGPYVCSNLTFENMTIYNIGGRGFSLSAAAGSYGTTSPDTTRWINCDVYNCADMRSTVPGNAADGWKIDSEANTVFYFNGCRVWGCTDDGIDMSGSGIGYWNNCWILQNGFDGAADGNGLKFGAVRGDSAYMFEGSLVLGDSIPGELRHVRNCITAYNGGIGYYDLQYYPYYPNVSRLFNNISWHDGAGLQISDNILHPATFSLFRNNAIIAPVQRDVGSRPQTVITRSYYEESNNTWDYANADVVGSLFFWIPAVDVTGTDADYSVTNSATIVSQMKAARKADGSQPDLTCFRLKSGSDLIHAGTYVGMSATPDIGIDWEYLDAGSPPDPPVSNSRKIAVSSNGRLLISRNGHILLIP